MEIWRPFQLLATALLVPHVVPPTVPAPPLPVIAPFEVGLRPAPGRPARLLRRHYYEWVGGSKSLTPPVAAGREARAPFSPGTVALTFTPEAEAWARACGQPARRVASLDDLRDRLVRDPKSVALVPFRSVTLTERALSRPFPIDWWWIGSTPRWPAAARLVRNPDIEREPRRYAVVAVGDLMMGRSVGATLLRKGRDYPLAAVRQWLSEAALTMGNLECAISSRGTPIPDKAYTFRAPLVARQALREAGFDLLSLGNNHSMDYGPEALADTITALDDVGIDTVGAGRNTAEAARMAVRTLPDGTRLGVLGLSLVVPPGTDAEAKRAGVYWQEATVMKRRIRALRPTVDLLFVQVHWGAEHTMIPNALQREYGRAMIDAGADAVFGHHAHSVQEIERYRGKPIFYGLGNFVFDMDHRLHTAEGLAVRLWIADGRLQSIDLQPALIRKGEPRWAPWGPVVGRGADAVLKEIFEVSSTW